jgi:hypothetical protein
MSKEAGIASQTAKDKSGQIKPWHDLMGKMCTFQIDKRYDRILTGNQWFISNHASPSQFYFSGKYNMESNISVVSAVQVRHQRAILKL